MTTIERPKKIIQKEIIALRMLKKKVIIAWTLKPKKTTNNEEGD